MALSLYRLHPRAIATASKPGMYSDGGGLYLRVTKAGSRQWVFVYRWDRRRRELGIGGALKVSLAKAREIAHAKRELLVDGIDPIAEKRAKRSVPTFAELADEWIAHRESSVRNDKSVLRWRRTLGESGYAKALRPLKVNEIATDHVLEVLRPIWSMGATATLARGYIEAVLDAATARKLRMGDNPARWRGHLDHLLPKPQKLARGHHEALPYDAAPAFIVDLRKRKGIPARALEFMILTGVRSGEARGARWGEIDLAAKLWNIPAERMKAGKPHTVPLSDRALAILAELRPEEVEPNALVFPSQVGKPLSDMACTMVLRRMGVGVTVHGFRSTFRDWAGDCTDHPRDLLETALAHSLGGVEAAYRRAAALEKRRALMADWSAYLAVSKPAAQSDAADALRSAPL